MSKLLVAMRSGLKAFVMTFASRVSWWSSRVGATYLNYAGLVGDGRGNAIVQAVIQWECRAFPEAPLRVMRRQGDEREPVDNHPLITLLTRPNPYYSGVLLWMATLADWMATGNAYWIKERSAQKRTVRLWWTPSNLIEPAFPDDGRTFISGYRYTPGAEELMLAPADVVHFRYGMDPNNVRKGLSPLAALVREIFTDDEGANWTAALLRNMGIPGVILAPGEAEAEFSDPQEIKDTFTQAFTGDNRGAAMAMSRKTEVTTLGWNPQQMDMKVVRRIPEERVTAMYGVPAVVVGLGAGLDRSTFNNFSEAREAAYESNIIPTQRLFAADLNTQLLPDFGDPNTDEVEFDLSNVRVLQEDQNGLHERAREDVKAGLITINQGLAMIGQEQIDGGDIRYVPISVTPTPEDQLVPPPPAPVPAATPQNQEPIPPELRGLELGWADLASPRLLKGPSQYGPGMLRIRRRLTAGLTSEMGSFLDEQQARVLAGLRTVTKDIADEIFDDAAESERLRVLLEPWYQRALTASAELAQSALGISFTIDDPLTREFLRQSGTKITLITDTTREAIRAALAEGQSQGEAYTQLARRIRDLPAFDANRARLVARTELGESTNRATLVSFTASKVVAGVEVTDGDEFDDVCAQMNGRRFTMTEASAVPLLAHPNCTRAFSPITDARELHSLSGNGHIKESAVGARS